MPMPSWQDARAIRFRQLMVFTPNIIPVKNLMLTVELYHDVNFSLGSHEILVMIAYVQTSLSRSPVSPEHTLLTYINWVQRRMSSFFSYSPTR